MEMGRTQLSGSLCPEDDRPVTVTPVSAQCLVDRPCTRLDPEQQTAAGKVVLECLKRYDAILAR